MSRQHNVCILQTAGTRASTVGHDLLNAAGTGADTDVGTAAEVLDGSAAAFVFAIACADACFIILFLVSTLRPGPSSGALLSYLK